MSLMSAAEAADVLGVSARRVRQMLLDDDLRGRRIGSRWVVDSADVERMSDRRPVPGRPWSASMAWAFLALADGRSAELSAINRHRLNGRLEEGVLPHLARLRSRSDERQFYAHPGVLDELSSDPAIVRSGVSAAADHGLDVVANDQFEGYIRASDLAARVQRLALDEASSRPNVVLRVVDDPAWPFEDHERLAPLVVCAVDLADSADARSRRAGIDALENP